MHFYLCTNSKHIQKHIFFSHQPTSSDLSIRDNFISWTFHSYHTMAMRAIIWEDILKIYVEMLFSHSVVSNSLQPHESQHARPPVHHQLLEFTETHDHWVSDAIQPSHPLSSLSPPAPNPSQHQGLFKWVSTLHQVAQVLEFQLQHQSSQWIFRADFL